MVQSTVDPHPKTVPVPTKPHHQPTHAESVLVPCYATGSRARLVSISFRLPLYTNDCWSSNQFLLLHPCVAKCYPDPWGRGRVFLPANGVRSRHLLIPLYLIHHTIRYGVVMLFIDESRKWWNRAHPKSLLAKIAW